MESTIKVSKRSFDVKVSETTTVHYELSEAGHILSRTAYDSEGRMTSLLQKTENGHYLERIFSPEEE